MNIDNVCVKPGHFSLFHVIYWVLLPSAMAGCASSSSYLFCFVFLSRIDDFLCPPTTMEGQNDEKILLEQLVSFLSGKDETELAELDRALGIDKLVQVWRASPAWRWACGRDRPSALEASAAEHAVIVMSADKTQTKSTYR